MRPGPCAPSSPICARGRGDGWPGLEALRLSSPDTAIILPPNEGFGPEAVGAIGLLVHRLARAGAEGVVLGLPTDGAPFPDVPFRPVQPGWGLTRAARYVRGLLTIMRQISPSLIEVHNRPEIALGLT